MARVQNLAGTGKRTAYRPFEIREMSQREIRKAYSDLRNIAVKRIARLEKAGIETTLTQENFPRVKDLTESQIRERLATVSKYVRNPESRVPTAKIIQEKKRESLTKSGYEVKNLKAFGAFMEQARTRQKGRSYDSASAATLYESLERVYMAPERFTKYFQSYLNSATTAYNAAARLEKWAAGHPEQTLSIRGIKDVLRGKA